MAAFAQTPATGFTPSSGNAWYDSSHLANSRARAYYVYDAGGRLTQLNHWWDTWNSGTSSYNTPVAVLNNTCDYEISSTGTGNANRGLKTNSYFGVQDSSDPTTFMLAHQEQYAYDDNLDYLTQAKYDDNADSTWDQTDNWSYDAAGNRNDATVVDNLNRATTIGGVSRTYDVLGNTLTIGSSKTMTWDVLNRMLSLDNGTTTTNYAYRADGMRVVKETGTKLTSYGYDGQMPVEESLVDSANSNNNSVIRYALGARGVDRIERTTSSGTTTGYPLYDAHGNNVATLTRSGSSYALGDQRSYDAWGGIRAGNTSGEPNGRYCANLGHLADDESGLVYMRARYYEAATGRFISEDSQLDHVNWYSYAANNPIMNADQSGKSVISLIIGLIKLLIGEMLMGITGGIENKIQNIERYMAHLDSLMEGANTAVNWAEDALAMRKEYNALSKTLKRYKTYQRVMKWGSKAASAIAKLMGYMLILSVYIDDIDLGVDGKGATDLLYG